MTQNLGALTQNYDAEFLLCFPNEIQYFSDFASRICWFGSFFVSPICASICAGFSATRQHFPKSYRVSSTSIAGYDLRSSCFNKHTSIPTRARLLLAVSRLSLHLPQECFAQVWSSFFFFNRHTCIPIQARVRACAYISAPGPPLPAPRPRKCDANVQHSFFFYHHAHVSLCFGTQALVLWQRRKQQT